MLRHASVPCGYFGRLARYLINDLGDILQVGTPISIRVYLIHCISVQYGTWCAVYLEVFTGVIVGYSGDVLALVLDLVYS